VGPRGCFLFRSFPTEISRGVRNRRTRISILRRHYSYPRHGNERVFYYYRVRLFRLIVWSHNGCPSALFDVENATSNPVILHQLNRHEFPHISLQLQTNRHLQCTLIGYMETNACSIVTAFDYFVWSFEAKTDVRRTCWPFSTLKMPCRIPFFSLFYTNLIDWNSRAYHCNYK